MPTLNPGTLVDKRYRVETLITRGGMSAIYRGVDERLDRPIALKILDDRFAHDDQFRMRFEREARAVAKLSHPSLVNVFDQGDDGTNVFLAMELVDGGTLRELLRERGPMPPHAATAVMQPVLTALGLAHGAGLIHRDVKPENILISDSHKVKLADFGLVRAMAESSLTNTSVLMGTVAYLSPEQVRGGDIDARSDVYSAGIVLFELLTGTTPFRGDSSLATAYMRLDRDVPPASSVIDGIPPEFDDLIAKATAQDPADRFANGTDFYRTLTTVAVNLGLPLAAFRVPAPRDSAAHRARDEAERLAYTQIIDSSGSSSEEIHSTPYDDHPTSETRIAEPLRPSGRHAAEPADPEPDYRHEQEPVGAPDFPGSGGPGSSHNAQWNPGAIEPAENHETHIAPTSLPSQERPKVTNRSRPGCILWLIAIAIIVAAISLGGWWLGSGRYGEIPSVTGQPVDTATQSIKDAGFSVADKTTYDDNVPANHVISVTPSGGTRTTKNSVVTLTVSNGKPTVPDIPADRSVSNYVQQLSDRTLVTDQSNTDYSATIPEGQIITVSPPAGSTVPVHSTVTLTVSKGAKPVEIPDLSGKTEQAARDALTKLGLTVGDVQTDTDASNLSRSDRGKVTRTSPAEGTEVSAGTAVTIYISPQSSVPTLLGSTVKDARDKVEALGLKLDAGSASDDDIIWSQNPFPGTTVNRGDTITVRAI